MPLFALSLNNHGHPRDTRQAASMRRHAADFAFIAFMTALFAGTFASLTFTEAPLSGAAALASVS